MADQPMQVFPLRAEQLEQAGSLIARAFHAYPLMVHTFPDPAERARRLPAHQTWIVQHGHLFGITLGLGESLLGVAVLFPPDDDLFSEARKTASGFYRLAASVGAEA